MLLIRDPEPGSREAGYVDAALRRGALVIIPTDTVYGIAAMAQDAVACQALAEAKGRDVLQPTAVVFATPDALDEALPSLSARAWMACRALLPGPFTLLVRNPDGFAPHLCGANGSVIGVRVPVGAMALPPVAASSANLHGEPEPLMVGELAQELLEAVECVVDVGSLVEPPSTVIDLVEWETGDGVPIVHRDGADRAPAALERLAALPAV